MNNLPVVRSPWRIAILIIGFTFLYAPMLMLVIYSFNSSKLVTVWAGWSTRWYSELFHDDAMMSAVGLSLTIAALAATRPLVQRMLRRDETPTNADRVLGQTARVTETIDNTVPTGAVYADGKTWTARSASGRVIPKDTMVKVQRMEGVRLFVEEEAGQPVHS